MKSNEYKCSACSNVYEKGWTDEEAEAESKEIWGEIPQDEQTLICDDCFKKMHVSDINLLGVEYKHNKKYGK